MLKGLLFDFGGTLDSDGGHWLDRFYAIYRIAGLTEVSPPKIKEAFYAADAALESDPATQELTFEKMMDTHVALQLKTLGMADSALATTLSRSFSDPSLPILRRNLKLFESLHAQGYKLGIVSNFYGNVPTLCKEFGYTPYLSVICDSILVGLKKPDLALFQKAAEGLGLPPENIGFIGDSFERDIAPAKQLGMTTFWVQGTAHRRCPDLSKVDYILHSVMELPERLLLETT